MYQREFTYTGVDGNEYTETYYFYLSKADLMKFNLGSFEGIDLFLKKLVQEKDAKKILEMVDELILTSVGEKSYDGKRFMRNQEIRDNFAQTEAYSQLFCEVVTDGDKLAEFFRKIIPQDLASRLDEAEKTVENNTEQPKLNAVT